MSNDSPSRPVSRIAAGRDRAARARRVLSVGAIASFGLGLLLVRATHSVSSAQHALTTPPALTAEVQGTVLGGGSIGSAAGQPVAASATS